MACFKAVSVSTLFRRQSEEVHNDFNYDRERCHKRDNFAVNSDFCVDLSCLHHVT